MMNPGLKHLQSYPFERLAKLRESTIAPKHINPINMSIGEPQAPTPKFIQMALIDAIAGTGKYPSMPVMVKAHAASGADMVTVAVRRVNLTDRNQESLLDYLDQERLFILPNTAGCYTAEEAIRTARLGREAGLSNWVKGVKAGSNIF